jgi:hypothetical protein
MYPDLFSQKMVRTSNKIKGGVIMKDVIAVIKKWWGIKSYSEIAEITGQSSGDAVRKMGRKAGLPALRIGKQNQQLSPKEEIVRDIALTNLEKETKQTQRKNDILMKELEDAESLIEAFKSLKSANSYTIKSGPSSILTEATAVAVLSDVHFAETVHSENVNGRNEYNTKIAKARLEAFFTNLAKLINGFQNKNKVNNLVLALLGDLINGHLRDEALENNSMSPIQEMLKLKEILTAGIQYLLDNTSVHMVIPCHSGNHGRDTKKVRPSTEAEHSYEFVLYHSLADNFKNDERVKFLIPTSYHSFVDVAGLMIRFHHGHFMKYGGGVGGIYISVNKAIAQWNKVQSVGLDVFGHFHQLRNGGNFICNGSVIGFNEFANSIKADFEKPKQAFFLVDHKRKEVTVSCPIFLE